MRIRLILSVLLAAAVYSVSYVPDVVMASLPKVTTAAAEAGTYSEYVNCSGEIVSAGKNEIYCAAPVYATQVLVSVGDRVEKGQTLAVIDPEITQAASGAHAGVPAEKEALAGYSDILKQYGLDSETAAALLGSQSGAIDTKKVEYQSYDVPEAVTATMDGIITSVGVFERVLTDCTQPLFIIEDDSHFGVRLSAGEADCAKIAVGSEVTVTGTGFSGTYSAVITKIYPTARKEFSGTVSETVVDMEALLEAPSEELKSGFTAKGRVLISEPSDMVLVPYACVRQDERNIEYLYVYNSGRAVRRDIVTGAELSDSVSVLKGLSAGESVVLDPDKIRGDVSVAIEVTG